MPEDVFVLTVKDPLFWGSDLDEDAYFRWLQAIPGVFAVKGFNLRHDDDPGGAKAAVNVSINLREFTELSLREMLALYHRYGLDFAELEVFINKKNETWVRDPEKFWAHGFNRKI